MLKSIPELVAEVVGNVERISMEHAIRIENVVLIDVRETLEVSKQPVAGSISIPRGVLEMKITEHTQDPATPICVHCATGGRAALGAEQLMRIGFTNVKAIKCGIDDILLVVGG
jgi:rhodanese-related sulfurtransferase